MTVAERDFILIPKCASRTLVELGRRCGEPENPIIVVRHPLERIRSAWYQGGVGHKEGVETFESWVREIVKLPTEKMDVHIKPMIVYARGFKPRLLAIKKLDEWLIKNGIDPVHANPTTRPRKRADLHLDPVTLGAFRMRYCSDYDLYTRATNPATG